MSSIIFLLFILFLSAGGICGASTEQDHYLLSCGDAHTIAGSTDTYGGRTWDCDDNSTFSNSFSSTITATTPNNFNIPHVPFSTARVFKSDFTYSLPVSPGPKFIRLFFNPSTYSSSSVSISPSDPYLTVQANSDHLLLRNFSAYLFFNSSIGYKEFYVYVSGSFLRLAFSPTPPSTYAFVNGIEVVSVPETLYVGHTAPEDVAQPAIQFNLATSTALETAYRLNVGGKDVGFMEDSGNMFREWKNDQQYLYGFTGIGIDKYKEAIKYTPETPEYTAPVLVYQTFRWMGNERSNKEKSKMNMTWGFEVDMGFTYLVRLHWCEVVVDINASNYRVFDVYIDSLMAEEAFDVYDRVRSNTAVYKDYVVYIGGANGSESRKVLQLALHPNTESLHMYTDVLLNGLEIFKLNKSSGSLDQCYQDRDPWIGS